MRPVPPILESADPSGGDDSDVATPPDPKAVVPRLASFLARTPRSGAERYLAVAGLVAVATTVGAFLSHGGQRDGIVMVYLLAVVLAAWGFGAGPAMWTAFLGVALHAYFFVPPLWSFAITEPHHLLALATLIVVAIVVATLTSGLRHYAQLAEARARHAEALRSLSRAFLERRDRPGLLRLAATQAGALLGGRAVIATTEGTDAALAFAGPSGPTSSSPLEDDLARRVSRVGRTVVARDPDDASLVAATPLVARGARLGVVLLRRPAPAGPLDAEGLRLYEACAHATAEALERARLADLAEQAEIEARTERLRNALLTSVSHDFRTPLAVIVGAASHLAEHGDTLDSATRTDLARTAEHEAERLHRHVGDLLSMTRLDAGAIRATKEWQPLEDVVGAALRRVARELRGRDVRVSIPADLPLVPLDAVLVEQVLVNLLDNAGKHTPPEGPVEIAARVGGSDEVVVEVLDRGPGIAAGEEESVFERFHRRAGGREGGVGLGLAVCRGIVSVHGGRIEARSRDGGGAVFRFTLPLEGPPPPPPPGELVALHEGGA
jgi:two-component system sensor histidine kinase KdpD